MLPPPHHAHSYSRSSQQASTKYSHGAEAGGSSSSHYNQLDKNQPNIGSTGKLINQMDMMKQAKLPKGSQLPPGNVFSSPVGSPNQNRQLYAQ